MYDYKATLTQVLKEREEDGGIRSVYFVACGGSFASMYPAKYFLQSESKNLIVEHYSSNEFCHSTPKSLGKNSIVYACSLMGNTPETAKAAEIGREAGAAVFALTVAPESPLAKNAEFIVDHRGSFEDVSNSNVAHALCFAVELLTMTEGYEYYNEMMDGFGKITGIVTSAKKFCAPKAKAFAQEYKDDKLFYTMGSGSSFGAAYQFAICILMEMQWINASAIHSGEYFHGPFEITDGNLPFIVLMSEGRTRPLDQRALDFLKRFAQRITVLDAKELGINTIDDKVSEFFNPLVFVSCLRVYGQALSEIREHPLKTRRYMWKVEY